MTEKIRHRRLFLALWPDATTRTQLVRIQKHFSGKRQTKARAIVAENIHITLHFLGSVEEAIIEPLCALLDTLEAKAFDLDIDRWGYFPRPQVLWLGAEQIPDALGHLVESTGACVKNVLPEYRYKKFIPHATVYRRARHPGNIDPFEPLAWHIDRYVLVESITRPEGVEYRVIRDWPLMA